MFVCLIAIGGLGFVNSTQGSLGVGILLVVSTLINMITTGPVCYPIVAETPSGRLRYKTIVIGRITYNLTGIFSNSVTPRMISVGAWNWGAKAGFFYAGTNLLCLIWCIFRLPETKVSLQWFVAEGRIGRWERSIYCSRIRCLLGNSSTPPWTVSVNQSAS